MTSAEALALLETNRAQFLVTLNAGIFGDSLPPRRLSTDELRQERRYRIKQLIGVALPDEYDY